MNKPFAIIQNDRTRQSFIRVGDEMIEAEKSEFDALRMLAKQMRSAPNGMNFMEQLVKEWRKLEDEDDSLN